MKRDNSRLDTESNSSKWILYQHYIQTKIPHTIYIKYDKEIVDFSMKWSKSFHPLILPVVGLHKVEGTFSVFPPEQTPQESTYAFPKGSWLQSCAPSMTRNKKKEVRFPEWKNSLKRRQRRWQIMTEIERILNPSIGRIDREWIVQTKNIIKREREMTVRFQ